MKREPIFTWAHIFSFKSTFLEVLGSKSSFFHVPPKRAMCCIKQNKKKTILHSTLITKRYFALEFLGLLEMLSSIGQWSKGTRHLFTPFFKFSLNVCMLSISVMDKILKYFFGLFNYASFQISRFTISFGIRFGTSFGISLCCQVKV